MKFNTILLSLCLFTAIYTLSESEIQKVKSDPFGSALNSLLEMHMLSEDASGKLNEINHALDQVEELLTLQNQEGLEWIERRRSQCSNESGELQNQIDEVSSSLADNRQQKQNYVQEQGDKQGQLATDKSNLVSQQDSLRNAKQHLDEENASFAEASLNYAEAIKACEEALSLLGSLKQSSFIQAKTQSRLVAVTALIQKHVPTKTSAFVQPIVQVLTELSTSNQINLEKLYKIISLIEQLLDELKRQSHTLEEDHATTVRDLSELIQKTEEAIASSEKQIKELSERLDELSGLIDHLSGAISSSEVTLDTLKDSLSKLNKDCGNDEANFAQEQALRDQQLDILKRLRAHFRERIVSSVENIENDTYHDELSQ